MFIKLRSFCFTAKQLKLFVVSILVSSYFLFSSAVSFAYIEELKNIIVDIENKIFPYFSLEEIQDCKDNMAPENLRFDNLPLTKQLVRRLLTKLENLKIPERFQDNAEFLRSMIEILQRLRVIKKCLNGAPPLNHFKETVAKYFKECFGDNFEQINFYNKKGGIQLGQIVTITLRNQNIPIDYYVKTHRGGLRLTETTPNTTKSSVAPKEVDPKELFVYKVFELIGLTPEVHIFCGERGAKDFYIATKDAGFDELTQEQKTFLTYASLKETPELKPSYEKISNLSKIWAEKRKTAEETRQAADKLEADLNVTELNIIKGLSIADILSRIFLLGDFTTNGGNIGFVWDDNLSQFKVIDFTAPVTKEYELSEVFAGFLSGNGRHCFSSDVDDLIRYVLRKRHQSKRVQTAREVIRELTTTAPKNQLLLNANTLDLASDYVKAIITGCAKFAALPDALEDLDKYVASVKHNLNRFNEDLLYTDDYIHDILEHLLPEAENFTVISPAATIVENTELLKNSIRNACVAALVGNIVVMPMHLRGNHWVGAIFRSQADGAIQVIYNDSLGHEPDISQDRGDFYNLIISTAMEIMPGVLPNIIGLQLRQQFNGFDCGPFTIDNLVRLARNAEVLDGLYSRNEIIRRSGLQYPPYVNVSSTRHDLKNAITVATVIAAQIRREHAVIFRDLGLQPSRGLDDSYVASTSAVGNPNYPIGNNVTNSGFLVTPAESLNNGSESSANATADYPLTADLSLGDNFHYGFLGNK